jgi:hypothetical protein
VEKIITSKLLKPGANKRIATVDRHVGIVSSPIDPIPEVESNRIESGRPWQSNPIQSHTRESCLSMRLLSNSPFSYRFLLASSPTAAISFPEPETKLPPGEASTRDPSRPPHSPTASAATYKPTHSTQAYDHSAQPPSSAAGTARQN